MIEPERNFTQVEVEKFAGYTTVRIEPMFRITPEALNPVDVRPPLGASAFLAHHDVITTDGQRRISMPVVRIIQATRPRVRPDQADDLGSTAALDREDSDLAIALEHAQDDDLAGGTPAPLPRPLSAKRRLIAFHGSMKRLPALLLVGEHRADEPEKALDGRRRRQAPKANPIAGHAEDEILDQLALRGSRQAAGFPDRRPSIVPATAATLETPVLEFPGSSILASPTPSHTQTRLQNLVRFV